MIGRRKFHIVSLTLLCLVVTVASTGDDCEDVDVISRRELKKQHQDTEMDDDDVTLSNTTSLAILSRRKRDFGGKEPIDWPKTYNAVFGVPGWMAQACEAFSDINFHLLGYNALGK